MGRFYFWAGPLPALSGGLRQCGVCAGGTMYPSTQGGWQISLQRFLSVGNGWQCEPPIAGLAVFLVGDLVQSTGSMRIAVAISIFRVNGYAI